jgi:hypothetical protein
MEEGIVDIDVEHPKFYSWLSILPASWPVSCTTAWRTLTLTMRQQSALLVFFNQGNLQQIKIIEWINTIMMLLLLDQA